MLLTRLIKRIPLLLAVAANLLLVVSFVGGPRGLVDAARAAQGMLVRGSAAVLTEWQQGIAWNFRSTSGFVTDNTGQLYGLGYADSYPKTRTPVGYSNSVTFGRGSGSINQSNRDSGADPRFAGNIWAGNGSVIGGWQIDLPAAGQYEVRIAAGRINAGLNCVRFQIRDTNNSTILLECNNGSAVTSGSFQDATCTERTAANWPSQNVAQNVTISAGSPPKMWLHLGGGSCAAGTSEVAHLFVKQL